MSEAEVWMEVAALRKMPKDRVPRGAGRVRMTDAEADEAAKSAFAAARTPRPEGHKRVVAEEMGVHVYAAGRYFFVRLLGDAVAPEREKRLLLALDREKKEYVRSGGDADPAEFARARPAALIRALRGQWD